MECRDCEECTIQWALSQGHFESFPELFEGLGEVFNRLVWPNEDEMLRVLQAVIEEILGLSTSLMYGRVSSRVSEKASELLGTYGRVEINPARPESKTMGAACDLLRALSKKEAYNMKLRATLVALHQLCQSAEVVVE